MEIPSLPSVKDWVFSAPVEQAALLAHRVGLGIAAQQSTLVVQQKGTVFHSAVASAEEDGGKNIDAQFFCQGSHMDEGRAVFCLGLGHHVWNACPIITQVERFREAHQFGTSGRGLTEILLCFPQVGLSVQKRGDHLYQRDGVRGECTVHVDTTPLLVSFENEGKPFRYNKNSHSSLSR